MVGGVVHVKLLEASRRLAAESAVPARMFLPGLVGSGALWLRGGQQVQEAYDTGEWLVLEGEPGVGKLALARAVHQRHNPAGHFDVLDAADAGSPSWLVRSRRALLEADGDLVIRHIDQLGARQLHVLAGALAEARNATRAGRLWVAVTLTHRSAEPNLTELLRQFPTSVALPPLRHHVEDLPELVTFFLGKLSQHGRLTCSQEAMKLLVRSSWPGNVEQLWQVMRRIVQRRRVGAIMPRDLPPECWTVSRRLLSPLEALERDAIVQSLLDTDGNKAKAAESLGMSRATIYRKIHEYGIVIPAS
jgi:transcriptional regulator of acetoin/glycerol metabolism